MNRIVISITACAVALVACRRDRTDGRAMPSPQPLDSKSGDPRAPDPSASVAAAPSAPDCPDGYVGNATPPWCIALPKGFRRVAFYDDGNDTGHIDYSTLPFVTLRVFFTDAPYEKVVERALLHMLRSRWIVLGEGEYASGHWMSANDFEGQGHFVTIARGRGSSTIRCDAIAQANSVQLGFTSDACRSLMVP
jgi:hypothetical protein